MDITRVCTRVCKSLSCYINGQGVWWSECCLLCVRNTWASLIPKPFQRLQYTCMEDLGWKLRTSMCLYHFLSGFCVQDWLCACWGLAWNTLYALYSTCSVKDCQTTQVTLMSHLPKKVFIHGQLQDASFGWGQGFTQHPTTPISLGRSVVVSCWSCTYARFCYW